MMSSAGKNPFSIQKQKHSIGEAIEEQEEPGNSSDEDANKHRVGIDAINNFYSKYKDIERNIERKKDKRQAPIAYLKKIEEFHLFPSPMGLVSQRGDDTTLNIHAFKIGEKYAEALSEGLKYSHASRVNLAQNRLRESGGLKILQGLNTNVKDLDLSDNQIGETGHCMQHIVDGIFSDRKYQI